MLKLQQQNDWTANTTVQLAFGLFLISLIIRALFGIYGLEIDRPFTGDEGGFHWRAVKMLEGGFGQRAHRAPLTAIAITPAYWIFGPSPEVGRWVMVLISSLGAPLVFRLGTVISGSAIVGLIGGLYWAVYPPSVFYTSLVYTENLSAVLVVLSMISYFWSASSGKATAAMLTGVIWGCLALNRMTYLLLPFAFVAFSILFGSVVQPGTRLRVIQWILVIVMFSVTLTPWILHTYSLYGVFMPHNTRGGWTLLISNGNLDAPMVKKGGYSRDQEYNFSDIQPKPNKLVLDNLRRQMAIERIIDHIQNRPYDYLMVMKNRVKNFWSWRPDPYDDKWTRNDWIMLFVWGPVLVGAFLSPALWQWRRFWPITITVAYSFFIVLPFWSTPRFRYPVDPLLVMIAVWGFSCILQRSKKQARPRLAMPRHGR
jgi:4-amino-4-deoxy-L-arabinose transferase-like glycosyltransferase